MRRRCLRCWAPGIQKHRRWCNRLVAAQTASLHLAVQRTALQWRRGAAEKLVKREIIALVMCLPVWRQWWQLKRWWCWLARGHMMQLSVAVGMTREVRLRLTQEAARGKGGGVRQRPEENARGKWRVGIAHLEWMDAVRSQDRWTEWPRVQWTLGEQLVYTRCRGNVRRWVETGWATGHVSTSTRGIKPRSDIAPRLNRRSQRICKKLSAITGQFLKPLSWGFSLKKNNIQIDIWRFEKKCELI